jgi:hypothetical protein
MLSLLSGGSAGLIVTSLSKPSRAIAIRTLRPNGEAGVDRSVIITAPSWEIVATVTSQDYHVAAIIKPQQAGCYAARGLAPRRACATWECRFSR